LLSGLISLLKGDEGGVPAPGKHLTCDEQKVIK